LPRDPGRVWESVYGRNQQMLSLSKLDLPTCAACHKPVDGMAIEDLPTRPVTRITVTCHGEVESVEVCTRDMEEMRDFRFTEAFRSLRDSAEGMPLLQT
jgi:hypothetical protein